MKTGFRLTPNRGTRQATVNARLASGFYDQPCILAVAAHDMTQRDGVWVAEPVVDIQEDDSLPQRITAAMDDADADEQEKRDRLIIRPERGDVSGEDAAVRKVEEEQDAERWDGLS